MYTQRNNAYIALYKQATTAASDIGRAIPAQLMFGRVPDSIGTAMGLAEEPYKEDLEAFNDNPTIGYLPGIAGYRLALRRKAVANELGGKSSNAIREMAGVGTSTLASTLLGAGLVGTLASHSGRGLQGALVGGAGGLLLGGLGNALGALVSPLTRRRTLKEQGDYDAKNRYLNYLIPGLGTYNYAKGIGASNHLTDEDNQRRREEKKKKKEEAEKDKKKK